MYTNILVPIAADIERDKQRALDVAQRLLADGGQITLAHVLDVIPVTIAHELPQEVLKNHRVRGQQLLDDFASQAPGTRVVLLEGPPGRTLTSWAENNQVDCIVVASHQPALSDIFLGSTAAWIVRHAKSAVHVIR